MTRYGGIPLAVMLLLAAPEQAAACTSVPSTLYDRTYVRTEQSALVALYDWISSRASCELPERLQSALERTFLRPRITKIVVIDTDTREPISDPEEKSEFSGIGKIVCPIPGTGNEIQFGTAFHLKSFSVMVTAAHNFRSLDDNNIIRDPRTCWVEFHDAFGKLLETIAVESIISRWDRYIDQSNDIAVIRLVRESRTPTRSMAYYTDLPRIGVRRALVVGFQSDVHDPDILWKSSGIMTKPGPSFAMIPYSQRMGEPIFNLDHILAASYDAGHGSSGSPVITDGKVIGVHVGGSKTSGAPFSTNNNYNTVVMLDEQLEYDLTRATK